MDQRWIDKVQHTNTQTKSIKTLGEGMQPKVPDEHYAPRIIMSTRGKSGDGREDYAGRRVSQGVQRGLPKDMMN